MSGSAPPDLPPPAGLACGHPDTEDNVYTVTRGWNDGRQKVVRCKTCQAKTARDISSRRPKSTKQVSIWDASSGMAWPMIGPPARASGVEAPLDNEWKRKALCLDRNPEDYCAPDRPAATPKERPALAAANAAQLERVREGCARCPVRQLCLADGIDEIHGYWAGTTPAQRARFRAGKLTWDQLLEQATKKPPRADEGIDKDYWLARSRARRGTSFKCKHEKSMANTKWSWDNRDQHARLRCATCYKP